MRELLTRNWWIVLLRGIAGVLFGLAALVWPGITLMALVLLFGTYAFVDGAFAIGSAFAKRARSDRWWLLLVEGILGIGAGLVAWFMPNITALAMVYLVAAWAITTGAFEIAAAVRLRKEIRGEWLLALAGVLSIGMGLVVAFSPAIGALALVWTIGIYALIFGVVFIVLAMRLRRLAHGEPGPFMHHDMHTPSTR
jgi:uncharacterized membrane protein HdeD (DUF308 family)